MKVRLITFCAWLFLLSDSTAWLSVLYQMIKVFILNRVTPKQFKSLPGVSTDSNDRFEGSNIYSVPEAVLCKWLTYHFIKVIACTRVVLFCCFFLMIGFLLALPQQNPHLARRVINFQTDCSDGLVLAAVLLSHVPTLKSLTAMHLTPATEEQHFENASKVIAAIKEVGLHITLTETDIVRYAFSRYPYLDSLFSQLLSCRPTARDMMLLCLFLYQNLPSYVPRTTIEFKGRLHDEIVKAIELSVRSLVLVCHFVFPVG